MLFDNDGKSDYLAIRRPDTHGAYTCYVPLAGFDVVAEFDGADPGEKIELELVRMTPEQFAALGDFEGW